MRESFGDAATRLSAFASQLLGWRPGEFWDATPAELLTCLRLQIPSAEAPDAATIGELKRRFPDN